MMIKKKRILDIGCWGGEKVRKANENN